jgi:arginine N-succinyltransferase
MYIFRPSRLADLDEIERLAQKSAIGITTLAPDRDRLHDRLRLSHQALASEVDMPGEENYFFVLEEVSTGKLIGTSGIAATAGGKQGAYDRFYTYRNEILVHGSRELGCTHRVHALHLCLDLAGHSLLNSFYIESLFESTVWPQLLSRGRLHFIAEHRERFSDKLASEHPGVCSDSGESPFWNAVGRKFFNLDYPQAERMAGGRRKAFIAELLPHYPIYVPLLPADAQMALSQLHDVGELPFSILMDEGFEADNYVDVFDGGPTVDARFDTLRTARESKRYIVQRAHVNGGSSAMLVSNMQCQNFRATIAQALTISNGDTHIIQIAPAVADLMEVADGDELRGVAL